MVRVIFIRIIITYQLRVHNPKDLGSLISRFHHAGDDQVCLVRFLS